MRIIRETETYRVIENRGAYKLQQNTGIWRTYAEYKTEKAALKNMDRLESYRK